MNIFLIIMLILTYIAIGFFIAAFFAKHKAYKWRANNVNDVLSIIIFWPISILYYWIIASIEHVFNFK